MVIPHIEQQLLLAVFCSDGLVAIHIDANMAFPEDDVTLLREGASASPTQGIPMAFAIEVRASTS